MENMENNIPEEEKLEPLAEMAEELPQEEAPVEEIPVEEAPAEEAPVEAEPVREDTTYRYVPPRRVSPYADSPYVMEEVPVKVKREKKQRVKKSASGRFWKTAVCVVLILALMAGSCGVTAYLVSAKCQKQLQNAEAHFTLKMAELEKKIDSIDINPGVSASGSPAAIGEGLTPAQVYAMNVDSVVIIYNKTSSGTATGSGFILSEDGYVVTNHHVVEGDGKLSITLTDGRSFNATLVGSDDTNDVALLKVEATGLKAVTLGSSSALIVGDQVAAIGNPLGELTSTLTVGYISAKERDVNTEGFAINMLQTDAAINSGNSGGPLFNMKGEVIGITTAKYSGTSASGASIEGVGFAIPIDDVTGMLSDLINYGYITGAYLGVMVSDMDPSAASYYGLPTGAYVQEATEGYAAAKAGVQEKDIIVELGGIKVSTVNDLTRALRSFKAGDQTTIVVYRSGREVVLNITLDAKPGQE